MIIQRNNGSAASPLFFSCDYHRYVAGENIIPEHGLVHVFAGELEMNDGQTLFTLKAGDTYFSAKNNLFRFTKLARQDRPLQTVSVVFSAAFLQAFYLHNAAGTAKPSPGRQFRVRPHPLWRSFFQSLEPYLNLKDEVPAMLPDLKQQEAFHILRAVEPGIDRLLADFNAPGKIDLEAFMQKNYLFNLPLERFAYLTGRSLSSFKRDFDAIFHLTPQRWLTLKRLELAHYLIKDKKLKPSAAYVEAGFENLSHFSSAFKNQYGYNPSQLPG